ncbi:MAG: Na+/H+ antiporter subunit E [Bacteroidales bacterium]|nr:Na+/H+ antiporter subunit E [Bacteroidales bacterium]
MNIKNLSISFIILMVTWLLLNGNLEIITIISGIIISVLLAYIFCKKCDVFSNIKFTPKAFFYFIIYFFIFIVELIKSNFDVARRVLTPSLPIKPGIVEVKTKLKSKIGRIILANSITLTPGTLTIEMKEDRLYIHWIDVRNDDINEATKQIVQKFEKYLEVIYG